MLIFWLGDNQTTKHRKHRRTQQTEIGKEDNFFVKRSGNTSGIMDEETGTFLTDLLRKDFIAYTILEDQLWQYHAEEYATTYGDGKRKR